MAARDRVWPNLPPMPDTDATQRRPGTLPGPDDLIDVDRLLEAYRTAPDPSLEEQRVAFGTSGHRGTSLAGTFQEAHVLAMTEAVCRYREQHGIHGPLIVGRDTHALSAVATETILEVLGARGVDVIVDSEDRPVPTPTVSHAIITHNRGRSDGLADGLVVTPSHNPPEDGGYKYNPPHGGPAETDVTKWIEAEANRILDEGVESVRRERSEPTRRDLIGAYVDDLPNVIDLDAIRDSGLKLGVDPLGGASLPVWQLIAERHGLDLEIVNEELDPTFRFVPFDADGVIRMDCSSPHAMTRLTELRDRFDLAFANDPDADRHGVVTREAGLMNPNHFLAACVAYLFGGNREWDGGARVGKTLVTSAIIDRVAADLGREVYEVPVGFKWYGAGLMDGSLGFGCEESAGASLLRRDGTAWSTDKDGIVLCLLAAEITARGGEDPSALYARLAERHGAPLYRRTNAPATFQQKATLKKLSAASVTADTLAGQPIEAILTEAPGNGAAIGGLKVIAEDGWFAARPSGTEDIYKIYAESFAGEEHLERLLEEAQALVDAALAG